MKTKLYRSIATLTFLLMGTLFTGAQQTLPDLSMRTALYHTGAKTDKIDLAKDKYVVKDATMELKKSQGTACDNTSCIFNIGFIATRTGNTGGSLSTYGLFTLENGGLVGNTVLFALGVNVRQGIHALRLKMGMNKVTFTIDPYSKTAESAEDNNKFSVNFKIVADGLPLNGKGIITKN